MSAGRPRHGAIAEINVTPMADVMIVLLVIFMVATPLIAHAPVRLPTAAHAAERRGERLEVLVRPDGSLLVAGAPLPLDLLGERLAQAAAPPLVLVQADRGAAYADVARVLAACRNGGAAEIALQAERRAP